MWFHGPTSVQVVTPYNSGYAPVLAESGRWDDRRIPVEYLLGHLLRVQIIHHAI